MNYYCKKCKKCWNWTNIYISKFSSIIWLVPCHALLTLNVYYIVASKLLTGYFHFACNVELRIPISSCFIVVVYQLVGVSPSLCECVNGDKSCVSVDNKITLTIFQSLVAAQKTPKVSFIWFQLSLLMNTCMLREASPLQNG